MVSRKQKSKRSKATLGNHQRSWIWGRHAVLEMLRAGQWTPLELSICPELVNQNQLEEIQSLARNLQLDWNLTDASSLEKQVHARDHQGLAARMAEFPIWDFEKLLSELPQNPFLLVIDRVQDPFNFGSMLRSADLFDVDGVIIGNKEQTGVSSHVARSSAGAVNYLKISTVDSLPQAVQRLSEQGFHIIAATEKGVASPAQLDLRGPLAIVIGNEGEGIQTELLASCQQQCAIPQGGHIDSLNAAVATGILCYEVRRQRANQTHLLCPTLPSIGQVSD